MEKPPFNSYIIDSWEDFLQLKEHVKTLDRDVVVVDTETDNRKEKLAKLFGLSLCFSPEEAFYIPIRRNCRAVAWSEPELAGVVAWIREVLTTSLLVGHNVIYDALVIENNFGFDITPHIYSDTILQKHVLDEERPFGLKEVAVKYLGPWADKAQEALFENIKKNGGCVTKDNLEMWKADTEVLAAYCNYDVLLTRLLFDLFETRIKANGLAKLFYEEEVMPLYKEVTIPMKRHGFPINVPHFEKLKHEIKKEIDCLEVSIMDAIGPLVSEYCDSILERDYAIKRTGNFPKFAAKEFNIPLPDNGKGGVSLAKKGVEKMLQEAKSEHQWFYEWLLGTNDGAGRLSELKGRAFFADNPDKAYIFNLRSNDHLGYIFFKKLGLKPLSTTEGGKPQCDDDFLESVKGRLPWVNMLIDFKKLNKLSSTYIDGILEESVDGVVYTSMLQFGTTGGRYSSTSPNLQNLPAVKGDDAGISELVLKYANAIREGFVAPLRHKIVDSDFSQLEPRNFASVSGDVNLQNTFHRKEDLYSSVAMQVFGLTGSANKKDSNYIGKFHPEKRAQIKAVLLASVYGASAYRIAELLNMPRERAQQIIDDYFEAFPKLKTYIADCHKTAKAVGQVKTRFGRIRHLPQVCRLHKIYGDKLLDPRWARGQGLMKERAMLKNGLNNSTNFPIQGLAAHIINRASIAISREFKKQKVRGHIALQIHDELCIIVEEGQAELAKDIVQFCMEHTTHIEVPLIAEPKIASNLRESK